MIRYEEGPVEVTDKELFIEFMEATDRIIIKNIDKGRGDEKEN